MKRSKTLFTLLSLLVCLTASSFVAQQQPAAPAASSLALNQPIPVESSITVATLPNGLRYYVRANKEPRNRAELRLVVKAGSILEDDDQQGLAHFVEHMGFNGTKNFPHEDLVKFLQSTGMRFGADVNAGTSFDETTYMLTIPTDKPEIVEKSIQVLEDWAHNLSFDPAEVDKERGVIMEEWRLRRGAGARVSDKLYPLLLAGSRYADRIPIGKTEVIQNFKQDRLKQFYTDWYRPDLMAVVVVGDFDKTAIEGMIKAHFAPIPAAPKTAKERKVFDIPDHKGALFALLSDKELTTTSIEMDNLLPARDQGSVGAYRQSLVNRLFSAMISGRFSEIAQKPGAPFVAAGAGRSNFIAKPKDIASLSALVKDGGVEAGTDALIAESQRVERFGFTATELDREKQNMLRGFERMVTQKDTRTSASHASEFLRNFVSGESIPGADLENALAQRFVPQITLAEVNALAKEWFGSVDNRLVIVTGPDKAGVPLPTESQMTAILKDAVGKPVTAYVDTVGTQALMDTLPAPGRIVKTSTREPGITEWELSNGVKVVLKPTDFRPDEILFQAFSPGGTSLVSDADYPAVSSATSAVAAGGLGKFNAIDLRKVLTGKVASAGPSIGELQEGMSGSASKKDLETMFQLVYLRFTAPRLDKDAFEAQKTQLRTILANQAADPAFAFSKVRVETTYNNHPRRQMDTIETVDKWDLEKSFAFYKDRFSDASDFTFVFVGDLDLAALRPFAERYLASLPATHRTENWKDIGARVTPGVIAKTVEKGIEPKSQVSIFYSGPFEWDDMPRIEINAVAQILQERLREAIREELGGTYSITASGGGSRIPRKEFTFSVQFGCDPQRVPDLLKRVYAEMEKLKDEGPTAQEMTSLKATLLRGYETNSRQNAFVMSQLVGRYQFNEDPAEAWKLPEFYNKLDAEGIRKAAKTYLSSDNRIQVTLMPEKK
jgi:zinc protease